MEPFGACGPAGFRIRSAAAYGRILGLETSSGTAISRRLIVGGIDLTIRRSLAIMFAGIDFRSESDAHGQRVMRSLVSNTGILIAGN